LTLRRNKDTRSDPNTYNYLLLRGPWLLPSIFASSACAATCTASSRDYSFRSDSTQLNWTDGQL